MIDSLQNVAGIKFDAIDVSKVDFNETCSSSGSAGKRKLGEQLPWLRYVGIFYG